MFTNLRKSFTLIFAMGVGLIGVVLVLSLNWLDESPSGVAAPTPNALALTLVSPESTKGLPDRAEIVVEVSADVRQVGPTTAEVVVEFDQRMLQLREIKEQGDLLALNKNLGNGEGRATVDLAQIGVDKFADGQKLVTLIFEYVPLSRKKTTQIKIAQGSTIGLEQSDGAEISKRNLDSIMLSF